jgi:nicotinamidase-related amidase
MRDFEDYCWKDVMPAELLENYSAYRREVFIGAAPALLLIDLYEMVYEGGARPVSEVIKQFPMSCGEYAWAAIEPTKRVIAAARAAQMPVFYTTSETRADAWPRAVQVTKRRATPMDPKLYLIRPEFEPQRGDTLIIKQRASAFFGTPLMVHLHQLNVRTIIICGETTSGCVRATAVDGYSHGFHVVLVEECCFDRNPVSHKINLFDLHHKYADVLHVDEALAHLDSLKALKVS